MRKVSVKPLSVNQAWKGRRYRTDEYKSYSSGLLLLLPQEIEVPEGKLALYLKWGMSNSRADWDNPIKPFQDILQKKYNFDDSRVYRGLVDKVITKKGKEFIEFAFYPLADKDSLIKILAL